MLQPRQPERQHVILRARMYNLLTCSQDAIFRRERMRSSMEFWLAIQMSGFALYAGRRLRNYEASST